MTSDQFDVIIIGGIWTTDNGRQTTPALRAGARVVYGPWSMVFWS